MEAQLSGLLGLKWALAAGRLPPLRLKADNLGAVAACPAPTNRGRSMRWLAGAALFLMCSTPLAAAQYLSQEPRMGALKEGERALVDDGSCGPGKV
jgi:Family of unknown function (DUF6719)